MTTWGDGVFPVEPLRFETAESNLEEFEALLNSIGISVAPGSVLEEIFLTLTEYLSLHRRESRIDPNANLQLPWLGMLMTLAIKKAEKAKEARQ